MIEPERAADGICVDTATVFLTGRECPWRCVMCDLWTHTTSASTQRGAIPLQIASAIAAMRQAPAMPSMIKLYNAGSFFDGRAVPPQDDDAIAEALRPFTRVVVESHPSLVGDRTWHLRDRLTRDDRTTRLEVAMGLETAHPIALERLNKGITVESFAAAAHALADHDVDLRVFLLIHPPFVPPEEQDDLARPVDRRRVRLWRHRCFADPHARGPWRDGGARGAGRSSARSPSLSGRSRPTGRETGTYGK